jgi:hypothetical protein
MRHLQLLDPPIVMGGKVHLMLAIGHLIGPDIPLLSADNHNPGGGAEHKLGDSRLAQLPPAPFSAAHGDLLDYFLAGGRAVVGCEDGLVVGHHCAGGHPSLGLLLFGGVVVQDPALVL